MEEGTCHCALRPSPGLRAPLEPFAVKSFFQARCNIASSACLNAPVSNGNWTTLALLASIVTSRPGTPISRRIYPNAIVLLPAEVRSLATLVISPTSFSPLETFAPAAIADPPSKTKPVNVRCTLPRDRMRSTISCPYIAAFIEIQRAQLFGFLRQITLANIHAIEWNARCNSLNLQRLAAGGRRSCSHQSLPRLVSVRRRKPYLVALRLHVFAANYRTLQTIAVALAHRRHHLQRLQLRNLNSRAIQELPRIRPG